MAAYYAIETETVALRQSVVAATCAARHALGDYAPDVQALAIRQLAVDVEIRAVAARMIAECATASPPVPAGTGAGPGPYTVPEVAKRMRVTPDAVKKWLAQGLLTRTKAGRRTLITEEALQEFIHQSTNRSRHRVAA